MTLKGSKKYPTKSPLKGIVKIHVNVNILNEIEKGEIMKKSLAFLGMFVIFTGFLFSYELTLVSEGESIFTAQYWLFYINKIPFENKIGDYQIAYIEQVNHKGNLLCEIYHLYPRGHILVSSYKEFVPVKSFSVVSDFNPESKGYEYAVLEELKATIDFLESYKEGEIESVEKAIKSNREKWIRTVQTDLSRAVLQKIALVQVEKKIGVQKFILKDSEGIKLESTKASPLLKSEWDQLDPYWNQCPLWEGERCVVGCVATAMAQIMRYYEWPRKGEESHSYYWEEGEKWLSANFGDEYDWKNMPYKTQDYDTQEEMDAVAELCYEAGVSVEMHYNTIAAVGSWAYVMDVATALKTYFRYKEDVKVVGISDYNYDLDAWFDVFKTQRDLERPVEFAIIDLIYGGHAVVVDGYLIDETSKKVHINMGWSGIDDAYYDLDNILDFIYTDLQHAVINIYPAWTPEPPINFSGTRIENRALAKREFINILTWDPNPKNQERDIEIAKYRIFYSGRLLAEVSGDTFKYSHRDVKNYYTYVYEIAAVDDKGNESEHTNTIIYKE